MQDFVSMLRTLADNLEKNNSDLVFTPSSKGKTPPRKKGKTLSPQHLKDIKAIIHKEFF